MSRILSKSIEKKIASLPPEVVEEALSVAVRKHRHKMKVALEAAIDAGARDIQAGKFTEIRGEEDLEEFFAKGRKRALLKAAK